MTKQAFTGATDIDERVGVGILCSMCGRPEWSACWMGERDIFICRACALEDLAGLFVDAVWCPSWRHGADAERELATFETRFYRALALAFSRRSDR